MANNKDKIRASAQKFLQKGQIDKAIREYQRLVEEDPKDVRTLLKIGDLQTRIGANPEATTTYGLVAQFYSEQGFFLKAVAVYKQILKLDPNLIEVNLKLADLYHQLGLTSDAANQYRQISQLYEQSGRVEDSIKVLQRMVELDPENVASRIKLAEVYAKQNMLEDARGEFTKAAQFLKSHHRVDDYVKVAERIIHFDPNDLRTTKELANIYIQKGDARRALAKLQICFKANPKDIETLNLLAAAFKELEQPQKTISVYREIARIHEASGDTPSFQSVMRRILAIDPDDVEARKALGAGERAPPPIRQSTSLGGPSTPPPRRQGMDTGPEAAPALAMPTRRVTGELSQAQVDAVQQQVNTQRRSTGDISPAQIAAMEAIAAQGAARRGTNEISPAQVAAARSIATQDTTPAARRGTGEVSPAQLAQAPALPDNALGRIVPAQKAVQAKGESPVQEIDRRAPSVEADDEIEVDTDFDEPEVETVTEVEEAPRSDGLSDNTRETVSRVLVEAEVYIKYGLKQKAVDHLRKIFVLAPDHREARSRYKTLLIDTGGIDEAVEVLLGMAAVAVEQGDSASARRDLEELLSLAPEHRRARDLLAKLGPGAAKAAPAATLDFEDDELVVTDDMVADDYVPAVVTPREASVSALSYEPSEKAAEIDLDADDDMDGVGMELVNESESDEALAGARAQDALDDPMLAGLEVSGPEADIEDAGITVELDEDEQPSGDLDALTFSASAPFDPSTLTTPASKANIDDDEIGVELDTTSLEEGLSLDGPLPDEPSLELDVPGATFELDAETEAAFELDTDTDIAETTQVTAAPLPPEPAAPPSATSLPAPPIEAEPVPEPARPAPVPVAAKAAPEPEKPVAPAAGKSKVAAKSTTALDDDLDALINSAVPARAKSDPGKVAADKAKAEAAKAELAKAEAAKAEAARAELAKAEAAKAEAARAEAASAEAAKAEAARVAAAKAEAARAEAERAEAERAEAERAEAERLEAERLEAEHLEAARADAAAAREEAARAEAVRLEAARAEAARAEVARAQAEAERAAAAAAARAEPRPAIPAVPDVEQADLSGEIAEVGFYLEQGLEDEARDMLTNLLRDHPAHSELLALEAKLNGTAAPALPASPALDYEPEPEMLIGGDLGLDIAADLQSAAADDDLQVSLDDVFDAFKKGVADTVEDADYATHYDLGIAYKEMELLSDAIREFELAARDPTRAIGALTMMGLCALQSGDTDHALAYFQRGLNLGSVTAQEAMALRYEIGVAYEGAGRFGEASKFFEKVHSWDASFRDVEERLGRSKEQDDGGDVTSELDDLLTETEAEKGARSKISYV